ncbi:Neuroguidin-A [Lamellibrachia satsuma]|nr:Neuroguidin-A [Lamellibrachia satsuma]
MTPVSAEDKERALDLFGDLKNKVGDAVTHFQNLLKKVENKSLSTAKGISFLDVKYHLLLDYLMNLTFVMSHKVNGRSIKGEPSIDRLVEIRTVLEKMRPIDQKLKYQIDKLIKTATTGTVGEDDPLRFKANPGNLASKLEGEEEESGESGAEGEGKTETTKVYKPPKLAAMHYEGDDTQKERQERQMERTRKRALSSSIMQDLRQEYDDGPEEMRDDADLHRARIDRAGKERTTYEEKYFMRMSVAKKEKNEAKRLRTMSGLDTLTKFGDIRALTGQQESQEEDRMQRRKKTKPVKRSEGGRDVLMVAVRVGVMC